MRKSLKKSTAQELLGELARLEPGDPDNHTRIRLIRRALRRKEIKARQSMGAQAIADQVVYLADQKRVRDAAA